MNLFFMDVALAQTASGKAPGPSIAEMFVMPAALFAIMYFFVIRPQHKRQKAQALLLENLKIGDEVVTSGGIIGRIKTVAEQFVTLEAGANTFLKVQKTHIASATKPKLEPAK